MEDKWTPWEDKDNDVHWRQLQEKAGLANQKVLKALTPNQGVYIRAIEASRVTICTGPAGAGKTFIPCGLAHKYFHAGQISKIILTRPLVSCGQGYGYRPGTVQEKVLPVMRPLLDALGEFFRKDELARLVEKEVVELWPLDDMRGASIKNSLLICDEAQNATYEQLFMLLTRFAKNTKVVVAGDATQSDLPHRGGNPLLEVMRRLYNVPGISLVRLTPEDIVRDPLVRVIHERLADETQKEGGAGYYSGLQAWYMDKCPACGAVLWWDNGDESDVNVADVEKIRCWACSQTLLIPEYVDEPLLSCPNDRQAQPSQPRPR